MSIDYIRRHYDVPAKRGGRIRDYQGRTGTITGTADANLTVRLDGDHHPSRYHPTWQIEYLHDDRTTDA
ncbi:MULTISPECIES: hypothetical protein [Prauserella salsuginis group]|uniref:Uncharacterized protein n=1 Tax=Prauserella salsuginis TaxID=387889 RepID=A0ABW6G5U3_9PSEU|nr:MULTISPECIES: hypothetical protein [Prauserella salsuginis group]MCR3719154.1 hypothetical protein [Prauserella flava]MCR3735833.1 hypothetical protein [Prauserella salsuginis]